AARGTGASSIGSIAIGASGDKIRNVLGEPSTRSARELWDADGLEHQRWRYPKQGVSILLAFESPNHVGRVEQVEVTAPSKLKTPCAIGIGSSRAKVHDAYGATRTGASAPGRMMIGEEQAGLEFMFSGGRVVKMRLGKSSE
ncbi:hypothetical protein, partial [Methylobacterium frigidaeris]